MHTNISAPERNYVSISRRQSIERILLSDTDTMGRKHSRKINGQSEPISTVTDSIHSIPE